MLNYNSRSVHIWIYLRWQAKVLTLSNESTFIRLRKYLIVLRNWSRQQIPPRRAWRTPRRRKRTLSNSHRIRISLGLGKNTYDSKRLWAFETWQFWTRQGLTPQDIILIQLIGLCISRDEKLVNHEEDLTLYFWAIFLSNVRQRHKVRSLWTGDGTCSLIIHT